MIGILLVTHGNLAKEMKSAMEHVVGPQEQLDIVCIEANDDVEQCRIDILEKVKNLNSGDGVCIATDMFGGTPSNLALSMMDRANVEILAGINLPMLIKIASLRKEKNMKETVEGAQDAGKKYINIASQLLGN